MKKILALLSVILALLMILPTAVVFADDAKNSAEENSGKTSEDALPSSATLVGTKDLPPISNQGEVGSCASQAITYMQFTNAVSHYLHSINPDIEWDPSSGDSKYLFAPKFTYQYSSAGTEWVYNILKDDGCLTKADCSFFEKPNDGSYKLTQSTKRFYDKSVAWEVTEGMLASALNYRVKSFQQIWVSKPPFTENGKTSLTTSKEGKDLLNKIKAAINSGNVVVTGGATSGWTYGTIDRDGLGTLGKARDQVLMYNHGELSGGHQVSIVGYDDNITCTYQGVKMKGAFLVANSWGDTWANKGYCWFMYDSVNTVSEYPELNKKVPDKQLSLDQFCFTYWDKDIEVGMPELMVNVEVEVANREKFKVYSLRSDLDSKNEKTKEIYMFKYSDNLHAIPSTSITGNPGKFKPTDYFTFSGKVNGKAETGYFTVQYDELLKISKDKTLNDYKWGVRVYSTSGEPVVVKSAELVNKEGTVLAKLDVGEGIKVVSDKMASVPKSEKLYFDFKVPVVTLPDGKTEEGENAGYSVTALNDSTAISAVGSGYSFKVDIAEGFDSDKMVVSANGKALTAKDGVYTFDTEEQNTITVEGVTVHKDNTIIYIFAAAGAVVIIGVVVGILTVKSKRKKAAKAD